MKLLSLIVSLCFAKIIDRLSKENESLRDSNQYLHNQLLQLAKKVNLTTQIQEDYFYNKQMIHSLIVEYDIESDQLIKVALADEMLLYTQGLFEDANLLGGHLDGISSKEIIEAHQVLKTSISSIKKTQKAEDFAVVYNEIKSIALEKEEDVRQLQVENANINAEIQKKNGALERVIRDYNHNKKRISQLTEEINTNKQDHND